MDERPERSRGEIRSPVLYLWSGPDSIHRVSSAPEFEEGSLCPFCGWDSQDSGRGACDHLVFELDEWPDDLAGVEQGTFQKVADRALQKLADAIREFVRSCGAERKRLRSLTQKRLRMLGEALVEDVGLCDDPKEAASWDEEAHVPKQAFQQYLSELFRLTEKRGRVTSFDTGDRWGTCPDLFWSPNGKETAERIAHQMAEDARAVRRMTR